MPDDAKRIDALEHVQRELVQRVSDLESQQRRQRSEIERSVTDMTQAAIRHIEGVSSKQSERFAKLEAITESTLALNKTQSETLDDVKTILEQKRIDDAAQKIVDEQEKKRAKAADDAREAAKYEAELRLRKLAARTAFVVAIGGLLTYLVSAAYVSQHHELPERPETHEEKEK